MKYFILSLILLVSLTACEKAFLGKEVDNSPEHNFELFWQDFDEHYGLFLVRNWNWDSIYHVYRPQVNATTTEDELLTTFKDMIRYLDDSHTFVGIPRQEFFVSGSELDSIVETELSIDLLRNEYLENIVDIPVSDVEENYLYAKVKSKDIGYIYLYSIDSYQADVIDDALRDIGQHKALIIDIRNNVGGGDDIGQSLAGRLTDQEYLAYTVQEKNGPDHDDFTEKASYFVRPTGEERFLKPVILLTDRITVSAAETFAMFLSPLPNVTLIGDTTAGDFSDTGMRRFLPNGIQYQYSIMMYLLPNGKSLDGIGHVPAVQVRNTTADIQSGKDIVFERALTYLYDEYGIE